jgi:hypothetical protein
MLKSKCCSALIGTSGQIFIIIDAWYFAPAGFGLLHISIEQIDYFVTAYTQLPFKLRLK